ncbi:MAG: hypothetical protein ACE5R6_12570 [Candidatus Heimdallarchaeota archaeon]
MAQYQMLYIGIAAIGFLLVIVAAVRQRGKEPDYRGYFIGGILWFSMGLLFKSELFLTLGPVFLYTGFVNRDKWDKQNKALQSNSKTIETE